MSLNNLYFAPLALKTGLLAIIFLFIFFLLIVLQQVRSMNRIITQPFFGGLLIATALVLLFFGIALFVTAVVIL